MNFITSPNMNLPVPVVGQDPGPDYATNINAALTLIDRHDHTPGNGVPITPLGININTNLNFNDNFATNLAGVNMEAQVSTPTNGTAYISGVDLYFTDLSGNNIRLTQTGAVAGTPGSITNLVSPASASYVSASKTFVWQSDTNIAANMDLASLLLRNISPNSTYALTLSPPNSLGSNFTLTLPIITAEVVGGQPNIMTMDGSGNMASVTSVDNSTIVVASNIIGVPTGGITGTQLANIAQSTTISSNGTWTVPAGVTEITVSACGGGGGGGGGGSEGASGGAGGNGSTIATANFVVTPGTVLTITIGGGGTGGAAGTSGGAGSVGNPGGATSVTGTGVAFTVTGGLGGDKGNGVNTSGGVAGTSTFNGTSFQVGGGNGGATGPSSSSPGGAGTASFWFAGGNGGLGSPSPGSFISGGGGGGGAGSFGQAGGGGNGGQTSGAAGVAGFAPIAGHYGSGGGGGGGSAGGGTNPGGHGGGGLGGAVVISWYGHS